MTAIAKAASAATLAANVARISAELDEARQDVAMLEKLKSAQDRLNRLTAEQSKAIAQCDKAIAAEEKAQADSRFVGLRDIRVIETRPGEHVLRAGFTVTYTRMAWDMDAQQSVPRGESVNGFPAVPSNVLAFLIERHPERIPAKIMDLAPGNPGVAFNCYFRALSRGYIAG